MADTDVKQTVISSTVDYLKGQPFNTEDPRERYFSNRERESL